MVLNQRIAQIVESSDIIRLTISGEKIGPCRFLTTSGIFATLSESLRPISVDSVHPKRLHPLNKNGDSYNLKAGISEFGDLDFHATSFQSDFSGFPLQDANSSGKLFGETKDSSVHDNLSAFYARSFTESAKSYSQVYRPFASTIDVSMDAQALLRRWIDEEEPGYPVIHPRWRSVAVSDAPPATSGSIQPCEGDAGLEGASRWQSMLSRKVVHRSVARLPAAIASAAEE
jgi:hypothetical protein